MVLLTALAAMCAPLAAAPATAREAELAEYAREAEAPYAVYVTGSAVADPIRSFAGMADAAMGRAMTVDTPVRIASNTKTFVAATVLRLHEQGRIALDAPVTRYLDPELAAILAADGYRVETITVRHLLGHSGGLYDHGGDPRFVAAMLATPRRQWTRKQLVSLMTEYADPQSLAGTRFQYSDTGYVLLGDIVERVSGKPLAAAVREALRFDALGLSATWWETFEAQPAGSNRRARQHIDGRDVTNVDASFDLYGGGGLVMSVRDLATLFAALFEGRIFDKPETLAMMTAKGKHDGAERYRLGLFAQPGPKGEIFSHTGFWGTGVYYDPAARRTVAIATTRQEAFRPAMVPLALSFVGISPDTCRDRGARAEKVVEQSSKRQQESPPPAYFAITYAPGPQWKRGRPLSEQGLERHGRYMRDLAADGRLLFAGPLATSEGGLVILSVPDIEAARAIMAQDPAVLEQKFTGTVSRWQPLIDPRRLLGQK